MMSIFDVLSANYATKTSAEGNEFGIHFQLALQDKDYIELGKEYAAASPRRAKNVNDRKLVEVRAFLFDKEECSSDKKITRGVKVDLIGKAHFLKSEGWGTYLSFEVGLSSKTFNLLLNQLMNKNLPEALMIETIGFGFKGYEGDLSWDVDVDKSDLKEIGIKSISPWFARLERTEFDKRVEEIIKEEELERKKEIIAKNTTKCVGDYSKQVLESNWLLLIIILLLVINIFTK